MKRYYIDELRYNFQDEKIIVRGWIIVDRTKKSELYIYIGDREYRKTKFSTTRDDVNLLFQDHIKDNEEAISFDIELDFNLENLKDFELVLIENGQAIFKEKIKLDKEILLKDKTIEFQIDHIEKNDENIIIKGWAYSKTGEIVEISENRNSEMIRSSRPDVYKIISECQNSRDIGFEIKIPKNVRTLTLRFKDKFSDITKKLDLKDAKKIIEPEKYKGKMGKLLFLLRLVNTKNIKKGVLFIKDKGIKGFIQKIKSINEMSGILSHYDEWYRQQEITDEEAGMQKIHKFEYSPKISIVVPTFNTSGHFLIEMIESVINQTYSNWELCIADGASEKEETLGLLKEYEQKDDRIKVKYLNENYRISGNTNEAIKMATGDYIALFDHDDLITRNALYEVVKAINEKGAEFIFTDEDKIDENSTLHFDPYFKSDYSIHMLRSNNYICHFSVFKRELLDKVGLFRSEYDGAQDYDMILRLTEQTDKIVHIPKILYHWRVHRNSTAGSASSKSYTVEAGRKAVEAHIKRLEIKASVEEDFSANFYKVKYELEGEPLVSIIIANKDHKEDLERCINSLKKTTYKNYEIIVVENNSETEEIFKYYEEISKEDNIKVVKWKETGFNYSAINNIGVEESKGEFIVLLNNDTELITESWLEEMVSVCQQRNVGMVGAKLYYPDGTIQHAGVVVGMLGVAGHVYSGYSRNDFGPFGRLKIRQSVSAVTAAAVMIRKSVFEEVGGLDETDFKVAFNDIDLCMKVTSSGYNIVWTPYVEMYHYESKSRGSEDTPEKRERFKKEIDRFEEKWGLWRKDPYYNINLDLTKTYPTVELKEKKN